MELIAMGKATAVLVEMVMLSLKSVEVMGIRTATGVVGKVVVGDGEGVMMMLLDAGVGEFEVSGSKLGDGTREAKVFGVAVVVGTISCACESSTGAAVNPPITEVVSVGEASEGFIAVGEGVFTGGALDVSMSAGAVFSVCTCDCLGASVRAGPPSDSVDVEVIVIYNAVCNAIAGLCIPISSQSPDALQFQTPRPGKRFWTMSSAASPHVLSSKPLMGK